MMSRDEYRAAVEHLEEAVTHMALLAQCFRRLERSLFPSEELEEPPMLKPDFNYMTGRPPDEK
jgi:hypothetical protein